MYKLHVPGSKLPIVGMVLPPLIGNPYHGYIKPCYYWSSTPEKIVFEQLWTILASCPFCGAKDTKALKTKNSTRGIITIFPKPACFGAFLGVEDDSLRSHHHHVTGRILNEQQDNGFPPAPMPVALLQILLVP